MDGRERGKAGGAGARARAPARSPNRAAVVDASALAAILFGEPSGPRLAEHLEGRALFAPTLLVYELANVCLKKGKAAPEKAEALKVALDLLPRMDIREVRIPEGALLDTARKTGLTAYDAAYLWLSRELEAELVTLDEDLAGLIE